MFHYLRLKNFYSVRDELVLDLSLSAHVADGSDRFAPIHVGSPLFAPKVVGIFGPNASGKSTLLRGMSFVNWFVLQSFSLAPNQILPCQQFNTAESNKEPIEIEIGFSGPSDLSDPDSELCRYLYSVLLARDGSGASNIIQSEALYFWPPRAIKRRRVFIRESNKLQSHSRQFRVGGFVQPLARIMRSNVSIIATLVQLGHEPSMWLRENFAAKITANILVQKFEQPDQQLTQMYASNESMLKALNSEIQRLDLGIEKIVVSPLPNQPNQFQMTFVHNGLATPLNPPFESNGTRQFVKVFPIIATALKTGGIALIDELDSSIHPLILPEIIGWFYDPVRNPHNAQLWFTCQNATLLSEMKKEEVYFCEKDTNGRTDAFGLRDFRSVRRIDNYTKKYLGGAYGAVPHIG